MLHTVFESLGYLLGFGLFRLLRRRHDHPTDHPDGGWILVGAVLGAALGSKALDALQYASFMVDHWRDPTVLFGGKTIVGGLVGGWAGVELAKWRIGVTRSTGDLLVWPLILGIGVGRIGCLLAGPDDHTSGYLTDVAWAIGGRHPTQLYELGALAVLALANTIPGRDGVRFNRFIAGYMLFRVAVDFFKAPWGPDPLEPTPDRFGLTPIQWAAGIGGLIALVRGAPTWLAFAPRPPGGPRPHATLTPPGSLP